MDGSLRARVAAATAGVNAAGTLSVPLVKGHILGHENANE